MQVWKFGGTSVGKPERMQSIRRLVTEDGTRKMVVLSALSGTTNSLLEIGTLLKSNQEEEALLKVGSGVHGKEAKLRSYCDLCQGCRAVCYLY